ncbi:MAG: hypothetical protein IIB46_07995 [Nitrospinae bacterium]|nr:hypothetical protein [Nitrospinota bacterium]
MKIETAFQTIRILIERRKGFSLKLNISPEGDVTLEKPITIKHGESAKEIAEKLIHE